MTGQTLFLAIFVVLQVLDIWTTLVALKRGHREMNPVLAKAFTYAEPLAVMVAIKIPGVWALWWADIALLTAAVCAVYIYVVVNNLRVIGKV
jgi:hypothetical protein